MFDSIQEAQKAIHSSRDDLKRKSVPDDDSVFDLLLGLQQVLEIAVASEHKAQALTPREVSDIGDRGLSLVDNLVLNLMEKNLLTEKQDIEQVALVIAQWVIDHHGVLNNIQSVVDGLAYLANAVHDKVILAQIAVFMGQVAYACNVILKHDLDNSKLTRPWRVLNINRGIVATRSHDLEIIAVVYADMIRNIPLDAPDFFSEGMSEMVRQNYPDSVRDVVQEFYEQTKLPVIH